MPRREAHDLVIRALDVGATPGSDIPSIVKEWRDPKHDEFKPRNAWSLFNAFTEIGKKWGGALGQRTTRLHGLFDNVCGLTTSLNALKAEMETGDVQVSGSLLN